MSEENIEVQLEVVPMTALAQIEKATVDVQIATAHAYPRSITQFKKRATEMVTMDEETAQSCIYRRPVGKDRQTGQQTFAEGKSIRMAEIVAACYGNIRHGSIIVEMTPRYVKARGMAHDLETNNASSSEVVESCVKRDGTPYDERMRVVIAKAALAKAQRDAIFKVVPGALCKSLEDAAREIAIGTTATLEKRRGVIMDWINKLGIDAKRVWAALQINGIEDVGLEQMETLTGLRTAMKDGDATVDDAFPPIGANAATTGTKSGDLAQKLGKKTEDPKPAQEPTTTTTPKQPVPVTANQEAATVDIPKDCEVTEGAITEVLHQTFKYKSDTKNHKAGEEGVKWSIVLDDGSKYSTFSESLTARAEKLQGKGVRIFWKASGAYRNAEEIVAL